MGDLIRTALSTFLLYVFLTMGVMLYVIFGRVSGPLKGHGASLIWLLQPQSSAWSKGVPVVPVPRGPWQQITHGPWTTEGWKAGEGRSQMLETFGCMLNHNEVILWAKRFERIHGEKRHAQTCILKQIPLEADRT